METPTTQSVAPNEVKNSQIPDLIKIGAIPSSTQMDVETSILEPVQHSQSTCRFVLENKGILHSHSKIVLSCEVGASALTGFYPINIGAYSLIKHCRLMSGGKTIVEQRDFNVLMGYESMFISNEHNKEKELYSTGRLMNHNFHYDPSASGSKAQGVIIDTGIANDVNGTEYYIPGYIERNAESQFALSLSDLFPFLRQQQLPLFMMKEQITIELEFEDNAKRMWFVSAGSPTININTAETKLIADYQYYNESIMSAFANQNNPLTLTYMVNRLSKQTIDASVGLKVRNIGGNGRIVPKIIASLQDDSATNIANPLICFSSLAPDGANASSNGSITLNVKYNNHLLYPLDVTNYAQHQHHLAQAQGMVNFVTRYEYCGEGTEASMSSDTLQGADLRTKMKGAFCWQAHRLNRNERVNSRGIEYQVTYNVNGGSRTQRIYLEMVRMATLSDGRFTIVDA
jgi:hypothetical protein